MAFTHTEIHKLFVCLILVAAFVSPLRLSAQNLSTPVAVQDDKRDSPSDPDKKSDFSNLRVEKLRVDGGAEIYTIFARLGKPDESGNFDGGELPLVSILRDTLGDNRAENDRFRYVWMLTYTRPSFLQRLTAFVPFFYLHASNKSRFGNEPPPPIADLSPPGKNGFNKLVITLLTKFILGELGFLAKAPVQQNSQNTSNYRKSAIAGALTVLSLYQEFHGEKLLSDDELKAIQAKLQLTGKSFGGHLSSDYLPRVYDKEIAKSIDTRGHNWELLRQYAESQGLYFEPLKMSDGTARQAIVWVAESDLLANKGKKFDGRFLNFKDPWSDTKLLNWKGYSEVRWFDADNRPVEPGTQNAQSKRLIPLALYGLDHPKIPIILVDFRNNANPKLRELSHRVLTDVIADTLSPVNIGDLPYFAARMFYNFLTGRRGADINQPSRLRSYEQLKLMILLDASLDAGFKNEIKRRVETESINPLENDMATEARIAKKQYENLIAYAKRPDGLAAKLGDDRREEMLRLKHGGKQQVLFSTAHLFSLGLYTHREKATPELNAAMDMRRQLEYHERVVRQVAYLSVLPEFDSDADALRRSLKFISENGNAAKAKTSASIARIFSLTRDDEMRLLCLAGLYRINNTAAKNALLAIYHKTDVPEQWRRQSAEYLKLALKEGQLISSSAAHAIAGIAEN